MSPPEPKKKASRFGRHDSPLQRISFLERHYRVIYIGSIIFGFGLVAAPFVRKYWTVTPEESLAYAKGRVDYAYINEELKRWSR